jgi:hypothetical protein
MTTSTAISTASSTAAHLLHLHPTRLARAAALLLVALAVAGVLALSFALGRWTDGTSAPKTDIVPTVVQPEPPVVCQAHGFC